MVGVLDLLNHLDELVAATLGHATTAWVTNLGRLTRD
jgi:hypothetical protein